MRSLGFWHVSKCDVQNWAIFWGIPGNFEFSPRTSKILFSKLVPPFIYHLRWLLGHGSLWVSGPWFLPSENLYIPIKLSSYVALRVEANLLNLSRRFPHVWCPNPEWWSCNLCLQGPRDKFFWCLTLNLEPMKFEVVLMAGVTNNCWRHPLFWWKTVGCSCCALIKH